MVEGGKAGSARRGDASLSSLYRELARAAADFTARHGERALIDVLQGPDVKGPAIPVRSPSPELHR